MALSEAIPILRKAPRRSRQDSPAYDRDSTAHHLLEDLLLLAERVLARVQLGRQGEVAAGAALGEVQLLDGRGVVAGQDVGRITVRDYPPSAKTSVPEGNGAGGVA